METNASIRGKFFTPGVWVLTAIAAIGIGAYLFRFLFGLESATNLDNQHPWGIWIAIDVACGVALAAGGFTTAALAHIFGRHKYEPLVRPALLTAMLGYTFVVIGLLADLGRYYNVWHPMMPSMWQGSSVLFEVGICVMFYLTVLYIEFAPVVLERFKSGVHLGRRFKWLARPIESALRTVDGTLGKVMFLFVIAGVVLSCLHQSSLGTLMLVAPSKMHPLWNSSLSPLFFLLSAIAVGYPMVMFESILASRSFKRPVELPLLSSLARITPIILAVYLAAKIVDLANRDLLLLLLTNSVETWLFGAELILGVVVPAILLSIPRIRNTTAGLFTASSLVIGGVALNRIDTFLVAYNPLYPRGSYFPSLVELAVTIGLIALLVLVYRWFVMMFPVMHNENDEATVAPHPIRQFEGEAV